MIDHLEVNSTGRQLAYSGAYPLKGDLTEVVAPEA